jgi:NADH-quinone oxidoreductase subunit F
MLFNEPSPLETKVLTRRFGMPDSASLATYLSTEGYQAFLKAAKMTPDEIINEVKTSNLRGRGGAGFPTGMKWSFVPRTSPKPKYIVVNGDEGEPGTCKDRVLIENDPHQLIEGILIAGLAVDAHAGYVYIRGEYRYLIEILEKAIGEAYADGWLGKNIKGTGFDFELYVHTGAGSYECGEESALLESLEGKRGVPRIRPPFPAVSGAFQSPTVLNNVETFCAVPAILRDGGAAFAALGIPKAGGTKMTCLSGHINKPGVYELKLGFPVKQMIEEVGGGIHKGRKLKAFIPGGSSCPVLTAAEIEGATMDYDCMAARKTMLGSGGVVIIDDHTCMVKVAMRLMRFYNHESCGWCIPCREGTTWLRKIMVRFHEGGGTRGDIDLLADISKNMLGRTFCPLGDAAAMPMIAIVEKFRSEFEDHLNGKPCPYEHADSLVTV